MIEPKNSSESSCLLLAYEKDALLQPEVSFKTKIYFWLGLTLLKMTKHNAKVDFSECIYDAYLEVLEKRQNIIVKQVARVVTKFAETEADFSIIIGNEKESEWEIEDNKGGNKKVKIDE